MKDRDMITIRNKRTGEVKTVPRSQFVEEKPSEGFGGIQSDIESSLASSPSALIDLLKSIPGGINKVGHYATTNNPVSTLANLGAGGVESGAALLSSPQKLMRYLADKFPGMGDAMESGRFQGQGVNDPTLFEGLMDFEKQHGLAPQNEEEASVRNAGGLMFGGGLLKNLPNMLSRAGTIGAEAGGRGGDPLHGALLSMLGESAGRIPFRKAPNAVKDMVQAIPELKANMAEGLPNAVGYGMNSIGDFTGALTSALGGKAKKAMADVLEKVAESKPASYIPYSEKLIRPAYRLRYADIKPETLAQQKLFEHITEEDLPKIEERGNAARRLGLSYLTPAELLLSPFEAAKQGTIGRTSAGSKLLQEKGGERFASEETAINTLLDNIYNSDKLAPEKQAAYDATMQNSVPPEFVEKWLKNENVKKAVHELETEPEYKQELGSVAKDSFEYWDHVKRVLADIEKGHMKPGKGTKQFKLASVTKTRNQMVDEMDKIVPEYENARKISERNFIRKDIERFFDKRKMTGNEFFKYIKSKENFNRLMQRLEPFPKAQQNLKDMHLLFEDLIPNKLSLKSSAALKRTSMSEARNKLDAEKMMLDELYGQAHDVAAVDLMTHPDLPRLIAEYLKNKQG